MSVHCQRMLPWLKHLGVNFIVRSWRVIFSKVDPNANGSLDRFVFVRWYVDEKIFLKSAEEAERLVGWRWKVSLMDIQWGIFWKLISLIGNLIRKGCLWSRIQVCTLLGKENVWQQSFSRSEIGILVWISIHSIISKIKELTVAHLNRGMHGE